MDDFWVASGRSYRLSLLMCHEPRGLKVMSVQPSGEMTSSAEGRCEQKCILLTGDAQAKVQGKTGEQRQIVLLQISAWGESSQCHKNFSGY